MVKNSLNNGDEDVQQEEAKDPQQEDEEVEDPFDSVFREEDEKLLK